MLQLAPGWEIDVFDTGGWTCARVVNPQPTLLDTPPLAEHIWAAAEQRGSSRLILDLTGVPLLYSYLVGQIVLLQKRVSVAGGQLRLCGLSPSNREVLHLCRLDAHFPHYQTIDDAVAGRAS